MAVGRVHRWEEAGNKVGRTVRSDGGGEGLHQFSRLDSFLLVIAVFLIHIHPVLDFKISYLFMILS